MKKAAEEESGEKAPLWIISFADMISLLMAFFVMLQTLAAEKTNDFMTNGREKLRATAFEFKRNIDGFGMPGLFGSATYDQHMKFSQNKYNLDSPDEVVVNPAIDGEAEKTQRLFKRLTEQAEANRSPFEGRQQVFEYAPIAFAAGSAELDEQAQRYFANYAVMLQQTTQLDRSILCIVGVASDLDSEQDQWRVSELRARAVARFLQELLPEQARRNVIWWGAGPAMDGVRADLQPFILLSIDSQQ